MNQDVLTGRPPRDTGRAALRHAVGGWLTRHAAWCLAASLAAHVLAYGFFPPDTMDLRVYREAAPHLLSGDLYGFQLRTVPPLRLLSFTYPPFAALVFLPLSRLPWTVVYLLWQLASVAALFVIAHCAGRLPAPVPRGRARSRALLWTAAGLWLEPVRHTLDQGQVNLILAALVLAGLTRLRTAAGRGAALGLATAVKLTPAFGGLYLLATRQWRPALWALAAGGAATALGWWLAPRESARYWTALVLDTHRIGPVWSVRNQSLRGALSRLLGQDPAGGPLWWAALALVTVLAIRALWAAMRDEDPLGILVTVELYGLLLCPISWKHHWIWVLPALMWLAHGPSRHRALTRLTLAAWALVLVTRLESVLVRLEDALPHPLPYPAPLAWPGGAYVWCAVLSLLAVGNARAPRGTTGVSVATS
ncbi:glycosyltransferase 87 family protein [Streptomyces sp. NPDC052396]|uniref:glycosyltransferase 87 family protein n=1 Tax=Streptomyces sp. NPDC052396 TaxID=3365689 RepID=UPI0037D8635D